MALGCTYDDLVALDVPSLPSLQSRRPGVPAPRWPTWSRPRPRPRGCCHRTGSGAVSTWRAGCGRRRRSTPPRSPRVGARHRRRPLSGVVLGPLGRTTGFLLERALRRWRVRHTPRARRPSSDPLVTWRGSPVSCRPGCSTRRGRGTAVPGLRAGPAPRTPCRHASISERRPSPARRREGRRPRGPRGCRSRPHCRSATRSRSAVQTSRQHIASGPRSA